MAAIAVAAEPNSNAVYKKNNQKFELSDFSIGGISDIIEINKQYSQDSSYTIDIKQPLYSFSITGEIDLQSDISFVQVVLIDKKQNEYLVYEADPLIASKGIFQIENICEETCALDGIKPDSLNIRLEDTTIRIDSVSYADSKQKLDQKITQKGIETQ